MSFENPRKNDLSLFIIASCFSHRVLMLKVMPKIAVVLLSAMVRASVEVLHYALTVGYTTTAIDLIRSSNLREAGFTSEGQPLIVSAALSMPEAIPALVNAGAD
jgi:hypothetical protein